MQRPPPAGPKELTDPISRLNNYRTSWHVADPDVCVRVLVVSFIAIDKSRLRATVDKPITCEHACNVATRAPVKDLNRKSVRDRLHKLLHAENNRY